MQYFTQKILTDASALPVFPPDSLVEQFQLDIKFYEDKGVLSLYSAKLGWVKLKGMDKTIIPSKFYNGKLRENYFLNLPKLLGKEGLKKFLEECFRDEMIIREAIVGIVDND